MPLSLANPLRRHNGGLTKDELAEKVGKLYAFFYQGLWDFCNVRTVTENYVEKRKDWRKKLIIKMGYPCKVAGFKRGEKVYTRIIGRDIVIRKDWHGYPTRLETTNKNTRVFLTPILLALGYDHGDLVIVLAKRGEIRVKDAEIEFKKLEMYLKKRREKYVREIDKISDYISENSFDI